MTMETEFELFKKKDDLINIERRKKLIKKLEEKQTKINKLTNSWDSEKQLLDQIKSK